MAIPHKHVWKKIEVLGITLYYCPYCDILKDEKGKESKAVCLYEEAEKLQAKKRQRGRVKKRV
jgi:hypothetical protein